MKVPIRDLSIPAHSTLFENGADSHLEYTDSELSNDSLLSDVYASSHDESDNDEDEIDEDEIDEDEIDNEENGLSSQVSLASIFME